jgi:hypothetical protein
MRASSGQSRDRSCSREGDEAVVYVYVDGYGDEGATKTMPQCRLHGTHWVHITPAVLTV